MFPSSPRSAFESPAAFLSDGATVLRYSTAMIEARGVSHHYGVRLVLKNVNLKVNKGELVVLMGPNGMGKSTLMAALAGAISPTRGEVLIDGKVRRRTEAEERAIRAMVVYLPAEAWAPGMVTGREWLLGVGRVYGVDDDQLFDHVDRLLDLFDLREQADSSIDEYSTGQRRKISVAAALVTDAPIMLLDEPFSGGLDPSAMLALKRVLLHQVSTGQKTIVMATPVPDLVEDLIGTDRGRVGVLKDGKLVAFDTISRLRAESGITGKFEEVYEKLVDSKGAKSVERYLNRGTA